MFNYFHRIEAFDSHDYQFKIAASVDTLWSSHTENSHAELGSPKAIRVYFIINLRTMDIFQS